MSKSRRPYPDDDFAHNHKKNRFRCTFCLELIIGRNHVRVYHTLSGLWRHILQDHPEIYFEDNEKFKQILRAMSWALNRGVLLTWSQ